MCIFPVEDLTLRNLISPKDLNLLHFSGSPVKWGPSMKKTFFIYMWSSNAVV